MGPSKVLGPQVMQYHHAAHAESLCTVVDDAMCETGMFPQQLGSALQYVACEFVLDLQTVKLCTS